MSITTSASATPSAPSQTTTAMPPISELSWAKPSIGILSFILFGAGLVLTWVYQKEAAFNLMVGAVISNATTIVGYYFGSSSGSAQKTALLASARSASNNARSPLTIRKITPDSAVHGSGSISFKIEGDGLNNVNAAKVLLGSNQIVASRVVSNENVVECDIDLTTAAQGLWDVVVIDDSGQQAKLASALKVT